MERSVDYYKDMLKAIRFPVIKIKKFKHMEKPPRWVIVALAFIIELVLIFFILWLFDERTVFDNDYTATKYSGEYIKWGWVHIGTTMTFIIAAIILFGMILDEFMSFDAHKRIFYSLYR